MKMKLFALIFIVGAIVLAYSQSLENQFATAEDFPRDALVYVQFADLPKFIKLWNESNLKQNYLQSENFKQFERRHLALKLVARFAELNENLRLPINVDVLASVSETRAALAVYDIGKMEAVFIAPVNDTIFSASVFFQNQHNYEEIMLEDGTKYYRREIKTDGGREKQKFAFANVRGRFVLASNEKLLLQTISNINGKSAKNSLADEPDFAKLAAKTFPYTATVWVNQTKLNDDYYFKHYWLMNNRDELKKFRAGMFDFEMRGEQWIERREFILTETAKNLPAKIEANQAENLRAMLSENVPFYKIQTVSDRANNAAALLENALSDGVPDENTNARPAYDWRYFNESDFYGSQTETNYSYLDDNFGKDIDEDETGTNAETVKAEQTFKDGIAKIIASANPQIAVSATIPQLLPAPMFAEFRKAVIFQLRSPGNLNRADLENALAGELQKQVTIGDAETKLTWKTVSENGQTRRELNLPMLGRGIFYAAQNDKLILSNSRDLLIEILLNKDKTIEKKESEMPFDDLTVIRLNQRTDAFDNVMERIAAVKSTGDFFTGNIGSLLDVAAQVSRIEIRRNQTSEFLSEEINFVLK